VEIRVTPSPAIMHVIINGDHDHSHTGTAELLDELLDVSGRDVLDVGCGEGWLVRYIGEAGAGSVVGVDPLGVALARARAQDPSGRYLEARAEALPFDDATFDVAILFNSLHHVAEERLDEALVEASRVLRPGGVLYVQEPLAEGSFFELMRPVDDETAVRAAAQAALARATGSGHLRIVEQRDAVVTMRLADFEAWRRLVESVEPARLESVDANEPSLRAAFERLSRPDGHGRVFDQPVRVMLLARA
jgi:hypothetical protein